LLPVRPTGCQFFHLFFRYCVGTYLGLSCRTRIDFRTRYDRNATEKAIATDTTIFCKVSYRYQYRYATIFLQLSLWLCSHRRCSRVQRGHGATPRRAIASQRHYKPYRWNKFICCNSQAQTVQAGGQECFVQQGSRYMSDTSRVDVGELATEGLCQRADVAVLDVSAGC
jgi:hypothetical protein